jgi:hypothetical protein
MCEEFYEKINMWALNLSAQLLWNWNNMLVFCERNANNIYNNNEIIKKSCDCIKDTTENLLDYTLKEPNVDFWLSTSQIVQDCLEEEYNFIYLESYKIITTVNDEKSILDTTDFITDVMKKDFELTENKNNICYICFVQNNYYVYIDNDFILNNTFNTVTTNVLILSIFYSHPNMEESIELHIPEGMLLVNNKLFNAAFVLRCLKMQNEPYIFDKEYKITILDSSINSYEIHYGECLSILQDSIETILL